MAGRSAASSGNSDGSGNRRTWKSGLRAPPWPGRRRARAGRGRRAARDYARQDSTTRWSAEGEKLGIQGAWPARAGAVSQRAACGRARPLAPRPRPARKAGGGQHQVGIEALQRVDPVGRRHLSSASASVPTSGDWPCASGATNWPSHGDRRPALRLRCSGRQRAPPAASHSRAGSTFCSRSHCSAVSASGAGRAGGGSATPGSAAAGRAHPPPARTPCGAAALPAP